MSIVKDGTVAVFHERASFRWGRDGFIEGLRLLICRHTKVARDPTVAAAFSTQRIGYRPILRIRDLPSKRLYVFYPAAMPKDLRGLIGGKIREELIVSNWPDLFRCAATMVAGKP